MKGSCKKSSFIDIYIVFTPAVAPRPPTKPQRTDLQAVQDQNKFQIFLLGGLQPVSIAKTMKTKGKEKQTNGRTTLNSLCSTSALLLSVVCCIALIHVELRIQEHHRLISHTVTFCDQMETEILQKVEQNYGRWQVTKGSHSGHWQETKG